MMMITILRRVLLPAMLVVMASNAGPIQFTIQSSGTKAQLRGVSAVSDTIAWASGSNGTFLRTTDGGSTWTPGTVPEASALDFRDVEGVDANTAYLMATAGRIYKTTDEGHTWSLQYNNSSPGIFLDALAFWDSRNGIALGHPINGRFLIMTTANGGAAWEQVSSANLPPAIAGEAAFAASGSCIAVEGKNNVWFVTGGKAARVFRSADRGRTWAVSNTPMISGQDSTGIFSVSFRDHLNGVIVGGDYKTPDSGDRTAARSTDGGITWRLADRAPKGYRSCVEYVIGTQALVAVGEKGCDYSIDDGRNWMSCGEEGYHSINIARSGLGWAVGSNGRISALNSHPLQKK